jgi:hypothetical protein
MLRQAGRPKDGFPDLMCHFGLQFYITRVRREDWKGTGQRAKQAQGCQQYDFKTPAPKKSRSKRALVACLATVACPDTHTDRGQQQPTGGWTEDCRNAARSGKDRARGQRTDEHKQGATLPCADIPEFAMLRFNASKLAGLCCALQLQLAYCHLCAIAEQVAVLSSEEALMQVDNAEGTHAESNR